MHELDKAHLIISGSNAHLLSRELGSVLTGRHVSLTVFPFSYESRTTSASFGDPIPPETKLNRVEEIMRLQEGISLGRNQRFIGKGKYKYWFDHSYVYVQCRNSFSIPS